MNAPFEPCRLSMRGIIEIAAQYFNVSVVDIVSQRREARIFEARAIAMYAIRELLPRSYPEIGRAFGGRDHTSAIYACRAIAQDILVDEDKRARVEAFLALCRRATPLTPPDVDPFDAARRIMQRPGLATNTSIETIRDFAAIVSAAVMEASRQDAEIGQIEALRTSFEALEPALLTFITAFRALASASDRGQSKAGKNFDKHAAALAAAIEKHFAIERKFK